MTTAGTGPPLAGEDSSASEPRTRRLLPVSVASQLVYGVGNFVLLATIAAVGTDDEVGAASLIYLFVLLCQAVARGVGAEALQVRSPVLGRPSGAAVQQGGLLAVGTLSLAFAVATALAGAVLVDGGPSLAFALVLPAVVVHDYVRGVALAERAPMRALAADARWLVVELVAVVGLVLAGRLDVSTAVLAWGAGALVSAAWGARRVWGGRPAVAPVATFLEATAGIRAGLTTAGAVGFLSRNVTYYLIGFVGGLAVLGEVRRALVPFGPLTAAYLGLSAALVPVLVHRGRPSFGAAAALAAAFALTAALWSGIAAAVVAAGPPAVRDAIGDDVGLVALIGAALVFQGITAGGVIGLRAVALPRYQSVAVIVGLIAMLLAVWPMTDRWGARGGAGALVLGNGVEALVALGACAVVGRSVPRTGEAGGRATARATGGAS